MEKHNSPPSMKSGEEVVRITGANSAEQWNRFEDAHSGHPALENDTIYALPHGLIDAICAEPGLEEFFTEEEILFERDLAKLGGGGFFMENRFPIPSRIELTLKRSIIPIPIALQQQDTNVTVKTDSLPNLSESQAKALSQMQQDAATDRWGYAGWLVTEPIFLAERDEFRNQWEPAVLDLGYLPPRPPDVGLDGTGVKEKHRDFMVAYLKFMNRWGLQEMVTWDIAIPLHPLHLGPNRNFPANIASAGYMFWEPCYRLREDKNRLNLVAKLFLEQAVPEHLSGWLRDRPPKWGPKQFARVWELYPYYELALKSRFKHRLEGNTGLIDQALAMFLYGVGKEDTPLHKTDSIKDARLMINRRLKNRT
jgi:hypothetical protein